MLGLDPVAQRQHRRQEHDRRLIVGVPARIGLGRDVIGHRNSRGPLGLFAVDRSQGHQLADHFLRRRRHELRGHLDPRDLGDDPVRSHDPPRFVVADARQAVAHHGQRQVQKGRGLDQSHLPAKVQVHHGRLQPGLTRTVDQVHRIGDRTAEVPLQAVDRPLHRRERQPGGTERPEIARPPHRLDDLDRSDPVGHGARHARIAQTVLGRESRVAQVLHAAGGDVGDPFVPIAGQGEISGGNLQTPASPADPDRVADSSECSLPAVVLNRVDNHRACSAPVPTAGAFPLRRSDKPLACASGYFIIRRGLTRGSPQIGRRAGPSRSRWCSCASRPCPVHL